MKMKISSGGTINYHHDLSRSSANTALAPILSSSIFNAYPDKYGSSRSRY